MTHVQSDAFHPAVVVAGASRWYPPPEAVESCLTAPMIVPSGRLHVAGKFLSIGYYKFFVRGVTYGTFRPDANGVQFPPPDVVARDFTRMAENGVNSVRTYTVPPRWLLDLAQRHGLRVMVGLPWGQHVTFLDEQAGRNIVRSVQAGVRECAGHPALLCYAIGNEIPAAIVRWYGRRRIERFIRRLYLTAKDADPGSLVTYVNYPTTEYLELDFLDLSCFNVFLENRERLRAYLARLQNIAGDRPLLLSEIGLDSRRNGLRAQARSLDWQVRTVFEAGGAGGFVFSWTDEWHRGGHDVEDWDFGLTRRSRVPKPALRAVSDIFRNGLLRLDGELPRFTVAVCAYNSEGTIRECLEGCSQLDYPDYEVIVVDDGSQDNTARIAAEFDVRLIQQNNEGLSAARNTALASATGDIVAYLDSDAIPDRDWLSHLAFEFDRTEHSGIGGPNIVPLNAEPIEECVANSPGGPIHVLLADTEAEHIPGCNMAFRRSALEAVGGFDEQFRIAGDDVDLCWRFLDRGWTLGYSAPAMVWHHRRDSVSAYWKQQLNYGRAEAMLERKWPDKYNRFGHPIWGGRIYGRGSGAVGISRWRVYHGVWGTSSYQSLYEPAPGTLRAAPLMPEWYLAILVLAGLSALSLWWQPLMVVVPLLGVAVAIPTLEAVRAALKARFPSQPRTLKSRIKRRGLTTALHLMQPLARLTGRMHYNLTPWRRRGLRGLRIPLPETFLHWSEDAWKPSEGWLGKLEDGLIQLRVVTHRGGEYDRWDLEVWCGIFGGARLLLLPEEHGGGNQFVRIKVWPRYSPLTRWITLLLVGLAVLAGLGQAWFPFGVLASAGLLLLGRTQYESAAVFKSVSHLVDQWATEASERIAAEEEGPEKVVASRESSLAVPSKLAIAGTDGDGSGVRGRITTQPDLPPRGPGPGDRMPRQPGVAPGRRSTHQ